VRLKDKICLITGAGKGIGAATAQLFAREGARVEIGDIDEPAAQRVASAIRDGGGSAWATAVDVTDEASVQRWIDAVLDRHARVDVLFNNAGVSAVGYLHEVPREVWDTAFSVNVTGVYLVSRAVVPIMLRQQSGVIINMSSAVADTGLLRRAVYAATKGAVLAMTKSMQVDYAPHGIRVNALLPGTILTPFVEDYLKRSYDDPQQAMDALKKRQLGGELGSPEDVAYAALFLASDESKYVLGSGLVIDGGLTAGKPY
jgi:NAD(P)-dependent dehydrogenase (short-subunit alcohol dehydrogenase family)